MVQSDGSHLLDGGVVNNLPADVMRQMTPNGKVIAIDVGGGDGGEDTVDKAPSILETMTRTAIMSSQRRYERMIASGIIDMIIRPEVEDFGLMDFRALEALVERGYRAGVEAIERGGLDGLGTRSSAASPAPATGG
jgi:NTE family protein